MSKQKSNFLCTPCRRLLCNDCREIADEYAELLNARTQALGVAEFKLKELTAELEAQKRRSDGWEYLAKLIYPEVITKWMDSELAKSGAKP